MRGVLSDIHARGAELVLVGNGSPQQAAAFADEMQLGVPVYTDPTRRIYRALNFRRSVWASVGWQALRNIRRAARGGVRQRGLKGDAWQQGGVVIIDPGGRMLYRYASRVSGDHPEPREIVQALGRGPGALPLPVMRHR